MGVLDAYLCAVRPDGQGDDGGALGGAAPAGVGGVGGQVVGELRGESIFGCWVGEGERRGVCGNGVEAEEEEEEDGEEGGWKGREVHGYGINLVAGLSRGECAPRDLVR
jgi:hypothetical protein